MRGQGGDTGTLVGGIAADAQVATALELPDLPADPGHLRPDALGEGLHPRRPVPLDVPQDRQRQGRQLHAGTLSEGAGGTS